MNYRVVKYNEYGIRDKVLECDINNLMETLKEMVSYAYLYETIDIEEKQKNGKYKVVHSKTFEKVGN